MLLFKVESENAKLKKAGDLAVEFFKQLKLEDLPTSFTHTTESAPIVYLTIRQMLDSDYRGVYLVKEYTPWYRWTKAIAYAQDGIIYVNKYKIDQLDLSDYVGNFAHETMHFLGYSHKGNRVTEYNLKSVPYVIGSLAEAWCRGHQ